MRLLYVILPVVFAFALSACESDYRPMSKGGMDEVVVVLDSTQWSSDTALALDETFGRGIETLPRPEGAYRLIYRDFSNNAELESLKEFKNVMFVSPIDAETNVGTFIRALLSDDVEERVRTEESFAFPLENRWVRDQWTLILTSTTDELLAEKIRNSEESLVGHLADREFDRRLDEIYRRGEQTELSDSLWNQYGWSVRMQHDYVRTVDTTNVTVFRRSLPDNDRWMWAWWQDDVESPDFIDGEWINATRDSLMEIYMRGSREESYITTEYRRPVETSAIEREDRITGFETLGVWRMTEDFMGGPFVNFTYYDPATQRLYMIEYGQFAPSVAKRRFVRQFQAMGRTFQADSTVNQSSEPTSNQLSEAN
ncbi:MAG: DUF4837 family protein [Balneolaceae bacterium]